MKIVTIVETPASTFNDPIYQISVDGFEYPSMNRADCELLIEKVNNKIN
jgi:hypothetical protein|tara:strand:+ start:546 stop:692 length:147 start_codon:yes stop_codon:yes gene_type:complete